MRKPTNIRLPLPAVKVYQVGLTELGHYRGQIDGKWGPLTDKAHKRAMRASTPTPPAPPSDAGGDDWWSGPAHLASRTGVRHNNPLNIKSGAWKGKTGSDARGHSIFDDPAYGIRAAAYNLRVYFIKRRLDTVAKILARWAPTSDTIGSLPGAPPNSPRDYSLFVQKRTGLAPNKRLRLFTPSGQINDAVQLGALLQAMAEYEIGSGFRLNDTVTAQGLALL